MNRPRPRPLIGEARRRRQRWHGALLLAAMGGLLALCGWVIAAWDGVFLAIAAGAMMLIAVRQMPPALLLNAIRARRLSRYTAPEMTTVTEELAARAGLAFVPTLYYVGERMPLAFTVGTSADTAIVLSAGLLSALEPREAAGVIAHEIVHVRNGDIATMQLASAVGWATRMMTRVALLLVFFSVLFRVFSVAQLPILPLLAIAAAPIVVTLLQLALARAREGEADLEAAELTGDPRALASALQKIRAREEAMLRGMFPYAMPLRLPPLLRDHPVTEERIDRLLELAGEQEGPGA